MVWKQDLAKLRQQLKAEEGETGPPPAPPPKKPERPAEARPIEEEDALFLQSMGRRPVPAPPTARPVEASPAPPPAPPAEPPASFSQAMGDLKGLRPLSGSSVPTAAPAPPLQPGAPPAATPTAAARPSAARPGKPDTALAAPLLSQLLAASEETRPLDAPPPPPEALKPKGPVLLQLAAGMAIDVDGVLDLRNHTLSDARERLRERLEDGLLLGWRSMHVILGPSEALRQGFLAFLTTPSARAVQRYAQAPVPMGGTQAWILYLGIGQP